MAHVTKSIEELVAENANTDREDTFKELWAINTELFEKVKARFPDIQLDPCSQGDYSGKDGAAGYSSAWASKDIDWMIFSWTGNPKASFTNMHLTIGLGPQYDVPNFGFALGTTPDLFFYQDYLPRKDLWTNPKYAEKYWDGAPNDAYIALERHPDFHHFISRHMYTRVAQSPNSLVYSADVSDNNIEELRRIAHEQLDRWLEWVDNAEPVPEAERAQQAQRDLDIRRTITEGDPANIVVEMLFGEDMADKLVGALWGRDRTLPRPV